MLDEADSLGQPVPLLRKMLGSVLVVVNMIAHLPWGNLLGALRVPACALRVPACARHCLRRSSGLLSLAFVSVREPAPDYSQDLILDRCALIEDRCLAREIVSTQGTLANVK